MAIYTKDIFKDLLNIKLNTRFFKITKILLKFYYIFGKLKKFSKKNNNIKKQFQIIKLYIKLIKKKKKNILAIKMQKSLLNLRI